MLRGRDGGGVQVDGPFRVTIMNRQYHKGRHIINALEIAQKIEEMPQVQSTRYVRRMTMSWF